MSTVTGISLEKEYEKNPDIKREDIQNIRDWLNKQPHHPHEHITDVEIILAYHSCEHNIELTKQVIDNNYTLRSFLTFYKEREFNKKLEDAFSTWLITTLTPPTNNGYRAIYCQLLDGDLTTFVYGDVVRAFTMVMDLWQYEEGTMPGVILILNMNKVSMSHLSRVDLSVAQQFFYFLQEAMFVRLKEFHFINAPSFIDSLLTMIKPFMKKEMIDMLKIHPVGSNTLENYISLDALPIEAGGRNKEGIVLKDEMWNKLKANEKFFEEESKKRVNESKRPGGPKTISSFLTSLEGTFKNLQID